MMGDIPSWPGFLAPSGSIWFLNAAPWHFRIETHSCITTCHFQFHAQPRFYAHVHVPLGHFGKRCLLMPLLFDTGGVGQITRFVETLGSTIFPCSLFFIHPAWLHLHLSPPYDVPDHPNHIFSESLSSGNDNETKTYKKTNTKTKTHRHSQRQKQSASKTYFIFHIYQKQGVQEFKMWC